MTDFLLDDDGDIKIANGDLFAGRSDEQHQQHIIIANKGEFKEFPELGVGIVQLFGDDDYTNILIETKKNLQYDGMTVRNVKFENGGNLTIYGEYNQD